MHGSPQYFDQRNRFCRNGASLIGRHAGGLARIRGYVGKAVQHPTWMHAARALAESNADVFPGYGIEDWLAMAKRLFRLNSSGRIVLDYDMKIAEPFRVPGNEAGPDMWPTLDGLKGKPLLVVRGERSDILRPAVAEGSG